MYIFELLYEFFKSPKYRKRNYDPLSEMPEDLNSDEQACNHCFLPLDSDKEMFACKYCGLVVSRDKLKDKNFFRNSKTRS